MCSNPIEGTYYQLNDKVYCEEDYMAHMKDTCAKCNNPVEAEHVKIPGSTFHPACFKCQVSFLTCHISQCRRYCYNS